MKRSQFDLRSETLHIEFEFYVPSWEYSTFLNFTAFFTSPTYLINHLLYQYKQYLILWEQKDANVSQFSLVLYESRQLLKYNTYS